MTPAELRAASRLGGYAVAGLTSRIEQVHRAVAGRVFGQLPVAGAPVRVIHDTIAAGVYLVYGPHTSNSAQKGGAIEIAVLVAQQSSFGT